MILPIDLFLIGYSKIAFLHLILFMNDVCGFFLIKYVGVFEVGICYTITISLLTDLMFAIEFNFKRLRFAVEMTLIEEEGWEYGIDGGVLFESSNLRIGFGLLFIVWESVFS